MESFEWSALGDVGMGRKNLGGEMPVAVYRLLQYTIKDELTHRYGKKDAEDILRDAGYRAGIAFAKNVLPKCDTFPEFVQNLQDVLKNMKIGVIRLEKSDLENLDFTLTVSEDLDCSGLPVTDETVCFYDEGFIAGILENFTGKAFDVKEIDCWGTGDTVCRFSARVKLSQ